ncbi:Apoptosis inhibitor 5 [Actinomortierella ambigua]|nr:Apoptosis inhibitor 5 [Actinomortierella ambigua]
MADIDAIYNAYNAIRDAGEEASQFPALQNRAIDGLFDLCEDESAVIRQAAIKAIPQLVKEEPQYIIKLVDVLVQLLQLDDSDLPVVHGALQTLLQLRPKDVITVLFRQGLVGVDLRKKSMEYIASLAATAKNTLFKDPEIEQAFVDEIVGVLGRGVSNTELETLARIVMQTGPYESGRLSLDNLLALYVKHVSSEKPYDATDPESVRRVLVAGKLSMPLFKRAISADPFLELMTSHVLESKAYAALNDKHKLSVLKLYSDAVSLGHPSITSWKQAAMRLSDILIIDVPAFGSDQARVDVKRAECATLTLYSAAVKDPDMVTGDELTSRFKALYAATQEQASALKTELAALTAKEKGGSPSEQLKAMNRTMLALNNTHAVVREFLKPRNSRNAKLTLHPSWQPLPEPVKAAPQAPASTVAAKAAPAAPAAPGSGKPTPGAKGAKDAKAGKDSKAGAKGLAKAANKPQTAAQQQQASQQKQQQPSQQKQQQQQQPQQNQQSSQQQPQQQQGSNKRKQEQDTAVSGGNKSKRTKILKRHGSGTGGGSPKGSGGHSPSHHQQTPGIQTIQLHSQSSMSAGSNSGSKQSHGSNGRAPPPSPFDSGSKKRRDQRDKGRITFLQR